MPPHWHSVRDEQHKGSLTSATTWWNKTSISLSEKVQSNPGSLRLGRNQCCQLLLNPHLFISAGWGQFCKLHSSAETPLYFLTALATYWRKSRAKEDTGITSLKEINLHLSNAISMSALSSSFLFEVDSHVNIILWRKEIILKTWRSLCLVQWTTILQMHYKRFSRSEAEIAFNCKTCTRRQVRDLL